MNVSNQKLEIIKWISTIEDPKLINQLDQFRKQKPFNFENEIQQAISGNELKKRTTQFLTSLDWKK
jgi:hypothetical protein